MTKKKKAVIILVIIALLGLGFMLYPRTGCGVRVITEGSASVTYSPKYYFYLGNMIVLKNGDMGSGVFIITHRKNVVIYKYVN